MSERVVCTIGCYDMLHVGHIDFLRKAARLGDMLIVGVPNDELYSVLKGHWPVIRAMDRAEMLLATKYVDNVDLLASMDYASWVDRIGPDVLALGEEHLAERFIEAVAACERNRGRAVRINRSPRDSSTAIMDRAVSVRGGRA
jgi:cytidyltransferase-like protein